jgi:hypothetical protein
MRLSEETAARLVFPFTKNVALISSFRSKSRIAEVDDEGPSSKVKKTSF